MKILYDSDGYLLVEDENPQEPIHLSQTELLSQISWTELMRSAQYDQKLRATIKEWWNYCPLPIREEIDGKPINLYPYQIDALTFMKEREKAPYRGVSGGILVMKMGLGKTLIAISHSLISPRLPSSEECGSKGFPTLIVASKTVMVEWMNSGFKKFFDDRVKVLYLHPDYSQEKDVDRKSVVNYDFVLTTYDICSLAFKKIGVHKVKLSLPMMLILVKQG